MELEHLEEPGKTYYYADAKRIMKARVVECKKASYKVQMEGEKYPRFLPRAKAAMLRATLQEAKKDQADRLELRKRWYEKKAKEIHEQQMRLLFG